MQALVLRQLFAEPILATARGTLERPFAGMKKQMVPQQRRHPEPLAAQRTLVPQVVDVLPHVLAEQSPQSERLAALGARVRLDSSVC